ncbi:hypothetical protein ACFW04_004617 [Cataglyphis niger]
MQEWDGYFKNLLGEVDGRVVLGQRVGTWMDGEEGKGVRQGSPHLFNLVTADMEKIMRRGGWGGVKLGERKIYTLAYADDVVLIAEEEDGMRSMIERLEGYLENMGLELNVGKIIGEKDYGSSINWWMMMGYGVEIWGWRERKELERLQERYLKWLLGLDWGAPGYMVRKELQREKLRGRAGIRAWENV